MSMGYKKSVTFDHNQCGSANSTNITMLIGLGTGQQSADANLKTVGNGGHVQNSNGYDIRPYSDSGLTSALNYELVYYDGANGKLEMHVMIPTLSASVDTVIYLGYGDSGISTDGSSTSAWDSNYKGVYHLKDGTTLSATDSTSTPANGTINSITATTGQIDGAANFDHTIGHNISLGNPSKLQITSNLTIEMWVKQAFTSQAYQLVAKDKDTGGRAYTFDIDTVNVFRFYINGGGVGGDITTVSIPDTNFHHLVGVYTPSAQMKVYMDASATTNGGNASASIPSATANVLLGQREYSGFEGPLEGKLDEVRISAASRSASWVTANYNAQKASSTLITWGSETASGPSFVAPKPFIAKQAVNRASTY